MSRWNHIAAGLSMLHEASGAGSAQRLFRDRPVLDWTLLRLGGAASIRTPVIFCWEDQLSAVQPLAQSHGALVACQGPRTPLAALDALSAARRWADGWRGGLLGSCEFDRGFHAPALAAWMQSSAADALLLVDPSAALVDPHLLDALVAHGLQGPIEQDFFFSPAAPGLSGVLLDRKLVANLAAAKTYPGRFLGYLPNAPCPDPLSQPTCAPIPPRIARTIERFTFDSPRQIDRLSAATAALNGQLIDIGAEELVQRVEALAARDALPREVVLELTTRRQTRAIFRAGTHLKIDRPDLPLALAKELFGQLAAAQDVRLTLAGVGDPLLADALEDYLAAAAEAGIGAIHLETDLLGVEASRLGALAAAPLDLISFHLPALTAGVYQAVMGVDGCAQVMQNVRKLVEARHLRARATPLLVPVFTKCQANGAEMELWYDSWLKTLFSAVIAGPSDCAGQIPDCAVADMTPPKRRPCARLRGRLSILCDGRIVSCEEDVLGRQTLGQLGRNSIADIWSGPFAGLRADHAASNWAGRALCATCRQWSRP